MAALSYAGRLAVTVTSDPDLHPDVDVFLRGLQETVARLVR